mgnify:CR=1 FL=1
MTGRALGAVSPAMAPLLVPQHCMASLLLLHAHGCADLPPRTRSCTVRRALVGNFGSVIFNIRKALYGFNPFFYT